MNDPRNYSGSAFVRIYFDLEADLAMKFRERVAASGKSQRKYLRDLIATDVDSQQETSKRGKK